MHFEEFLSSLNNESPETGISPYLQALWFDKKGDWDKAHHIIQDMGDNTAARIHAYLHRKEGDIWNADYWYSRAGKKRPSATLEEEWESIVKDIL